MLADDKRAITVPGVEDDMMAAVIQYAYTRKTEITEENVIHLLPAADQLNMLGLVKQCAEFLIHQLSPENCVGFRAFARQFFCRQLDKAAHVYLMKNFVEVSKSSQELMELDLTAFLDVITDDHLNVKNEEIVFDTVVKWINAEPDNRKSSIVDLLKGVRLGLLSTQYFVEKVKSHEYIKDNEVCKPLVIDTLKFLYDLDMDESREVDLTNPLARPRVPHEIIFVVGGWSGGSPTNKIETYDTRADRWIACDETDGKSPRAYHGCATVFQTVYVVGGFDGMDYFNSVKAYNPTEKTWAERAPMHCKRCYVSVAVQNNRIYAMGGFDGHVRQNTAEVYDPVTNQWAMIAPMNHQRSDASATTLNDKLYICGGFNGQECMNTAECFDINLGTWSVLPQMRNRRSGVGVISFGDYVYAVGGFNGITRMNSAERYNIVTNQWSSIPEMYNPRSNFAIEVLDDMVFAIGGFNGVTTIFNVECYDPVTDEWYDATDMNLFRSALSACLLADLSNMQDYLYKERNTINRS
ncbi:kelch-like protein 10 [Lineus longissimus]|uniref:kelch-like protein 10 n=1 Tax=Lineus longissimus TaxID=88925 RepID=UPI00315D128D